MGPAPSPVSDNGASSTGAPDAGVPDGGLPIEGVTVLTPPRFGDERGYFQETYNARSFTETTGLEVDFVQDNESLSRLAGTLRGLHYQLAPWAQGKLVRVTRGSLVDVVVDIRLGSPTYLKHVKVELSADNGHQLWVPPGLAHGFCTLEPDTVIAYKVTAYYRPEADRSLAWNDPALAIDWPVEPAAAIVSDKDKAGLSVAAMEAELGELGESAQPDGGRP